MIALLLLEIPALRQRYGVFDVLDGSPAKGVAPFPPTPAGAPPTNPLQKTDPIPSPMLWLSQRLAKNRERLGVHYASDSSGSRHLAAGVWRALVHDKVAATRIDCPSFVTVLNHAKAEWPTKWP